MFGAYKNLYIKLAGKYINLKEANRGLQKGLWRLQRKNDRLRALLTVHGINPDNSVPRDPRRLVQEKLKAYRERQNNGVHGSATNVQGKENQKGDAGGVRVQEGSAGVLRIGEQGQDFGNQEARAVN